MPTVSIAPYFGYYEEQAACEFNYPEWPGAVHPVGGYSSHAIARRMGKTVVPGAQQFMPFGSCTSWPTFDGTQEIHGRRLYNMPSEGPHDSHTAVIFKPPFKAHVTEAYWTFAAGDYQTGTYSMPYRIYAVAADDYCQRLLAWDTYDATHRGEFYKLWIHPTKGRHRRYRFETWQWEQPHTLAIVKSVIPAGTAPGTMMSTPNMADVVNEVMDRPGFKAHNKILFYFGSDQQDPSWEAPYDYTDDYMAGGNYLLAKGPHRLVLTY